MIRVGLLSTADIHRAHLGAVPESCAVVAVAYIALAKALRLREIHQMLATVGRQIRRRPSG